MSTIAPPIAQEQRRILVVDDEHRLAESLSALLRGIGYSVQAASSGLAALHALERESFDLVITDLRMDGVDGFDVMRFITEKSPRTAIIVITGHASTESAIEALHQRVYDYIPKPFDFEILRRSIEKVLAMQEAERLRNDLLHMLSHDVKVPLTSVLGFAQMIRTRDGSVSPDAATYAEIIISNCSKLLHMLDNYLTNSRVESGALELVAAHTQPAEIVRELLELMSLDFRKKGLKLDLDLHEVSDRFHADEALLSRALANLLSNAAKYTPHGGHVRVTVRQEGDVVALSVANSGPAIPPDDLCSIFDRYRRASTARGSEGSGLGLHIVRSIIEAHGGGITCTSDADHTEFRAELPIRVQ